MRKEGTEKLDPNEFNFPEGTAIFINEILCSYYKMLWNRCKKLGEKNKYTRTLPQMGIFDPELGKMGMFIQLHILRILKIIFRILT